MPGPGRQGRSVDFGSGRRDSLRESAADLPPPGAHHAPRRVRGGTGRRGRTSGPGGIAYWVVRLVVGIAVICGRYAYSADGLGAPKHCNSIAVVLVYVTVPCSGTVCENAPTVPLSGSRSVSASAPVMPVSWHTTST